MHGCSIWNVVSRRMAMVGTGCAGPMGKKMTTRNRPAVQPSHNEAMMAVLSMWHPTTALLTFRPMPSLPIDKQGKDEKLPLHGLSSKHVSIQQNVQTKRIKENQRDSKQRVEKCAKCAKYSRIESLSCSVLP